MAPAIMEKVQRTLRSNLDLRDIDQKPQDRQRKMQVQQHKRCHELSGDWAESDTGEGHQRLFTKVTGGY
jgi:hypothetical protein